MDQAIGFFFAWEGASAPRGPWAHLLVAEARGAEGMNTLYDYEIDLVRAADAPEVRTEDLLGSRATLRIRTLVSPGWRLVHGVLSEVEQLGVHGESRFRVRLSPPFVRATMMRKSVIWVDKTLEHILTSTLQRDELGMGLTPSQAEEAEVHDDWGNHYQGFRATFAWRCSDMSRLADENARPYCVQYEETDFAFVSRLLEEEGIAYHFEHTTDECVLVLSDTDLAKRFLANELTLAIDAKHREVRDMRLGGRLRPQSVSLFDYDWRRPDLDLTALSPSGAAPFLTAEQPARYGYSRELGEKLAAIREGAEDTERLFATLVTSCRVLSAGTTFAIGHPTDRFSGNYLVRRMRVHLVHRSSFSAGQAEGPSYVAQIEALWCGAPGAELDSRYRPLRATPRPRVMGTQTAVVTADSPEQEINVGGPSDLGCVRVRFHWDRDTRRHQTEPTSCWVRASQMFAGGRGHGAMFHPRVGDEVLVEFLEGDPDQPIIVGRVYNGRNLSPENATARPTYSCIKSMTSPFNGNYNMIAFDDLQGEEKFIVHAARDYIEEILHDSSRSVANFDTVKVFGDQVTWIKGHQTYTVLSGLDLTVVGVFREQTDGMKIVEVTGVRLSTIGVLDSTESPMIVRKATLITDTGKVITIQGDDVFVKGNDVTITASSDVVVRGGSVTVEGSAEVDVRAGKVNVEAKTVNVKGGSINLNC